MEAQLEQHTVEVFVELHEQHSDYCSYHPDEDPCKRGAVFRRCQAPRPIL